MIRHLQSLAFALLLSITLASATAASYGADGLSLRPVFAAGDRTHWTIEASQSIGTITGADAAKPNNNNAVVPGRASTQSLRLRITVLAAGSTLDQPPEHSTPSQRPASRTGTTLGVAFERLELSFNEQQALAQAVPAPAEAPPADQPQPIPPEDDSALAKLAALYVACALRIELDPNGRVHSITGLERVRESLSDAPDLTPALGPFGPSQMARTLESLLLFDAPDFPARHADDLWTLTEPLEVPGVGKGELVSEWTLVSLKPDRAELAASQTARLAPPVSGSGLSPTLTIQDQSRTITVGYDRTRHCADRIEQSSRLVVGARLGTDRAARAVLTSRIVAEQTAK